MTSDSGPRMKITYATLRADNEELHAGFEAGVERVRARLGASHRNLVDGAWRGGTGTFEVRSPIDTDILLGQFAMGTPADVDAAVAAARRAQPGWAATPWGAAADPPRGRGADQRAAHGLRRGHGVRVRQDTHGGAG